VSQNIGFNIEMFRTDEDPQYFYNTHAYLSDLKTPSECILMLDTTNGYYGDWPNPPSFFYPPSRNSPTDAYSFTNLIINICHSDGSNVTFADGHCKWMSGGQLVFHAGTPGGPWGNWVGYKGGANNWFDRE